MRILIQAFILFFFTANLYSINSDIKFNYLGTDMGLSQSTVFAVTQDPQGYIWLGTMDGLNMWDGYQVTVFKNDPNDSTSLSHNTVACLEIDVDGNLLAGTTGGGLSILNPLTRTFRQHLLYDEEGELVTGITNIRNMEFTSDSLIWMAIPEGLVKYNRWTGEFSHYQYDEYDSKSLGTTEPWAVIEDSKKNIWVSGEGGIISKYNKESDDFTRYTFDPTLVGISTQDVTGDMLEDYSGNIWIGTGHHGVYKFDPKKMIFIHYEINDNGTGTNASIITSLDQDENGFIYIGTDGGGVNVYDPKLDMFTYLTYDPKNLTGMTTNAVQSICIDKSGTLLAGTYGGGLCYYNKYRFKFENFTTDPLNENSLSFKSVLAILEDSGGDVWIGTDGGGLNHFDRASNTFTHYIHDPNDPNSIPSNVIINMHETDDGEILMGTYSGGLIIYNKELDEFRQYYPDPNNPQGIIDKNVWYVFQDSKGTIWIGYLSNGVAIFDKETETFTPFETGETKSTSAILEDARGQIWIGTQNGLYVYDSEIDTVYHIISDNSIPGTLSHPSVRKIYQDSQDRLWIGTLDGLNLYDYETSTFLHFTTAQGLPNNCINGMIEDDNGMLWISTNQGLCKAEVKDNYLEVSTFDVSDGLQGNEYNISSQFKSYTGEIYFGGKEGFNVFDPEKIEDNPHMPNVRITDFKIFNKSAGRVTTKVKGDKVTRWVTEANNIRLSYKQNVLAFEFAALDFANPQKNKYQYMLEGFDEGWIETDATKRFATYTNLPGGTYTFKVKGTNNDGLGKEEGTSFELTIVPPFWKRTWFWVLVGLALIYLVVKYIKQREESLKKDKEQLEAKIQEGLKAVEKQQAEVARTENELKERIEREKEQRWYNVGMAKFSEVLSEHKDDLQSLSNSILNFVVEYLEVVQGALYLYVEEEDTEPWLELVAGYALDEKRLSEKKIIIGEGQVGTAYKTQQIIQLDNLPASYASIESGLGDSALKSLVIVPLKMNEDSVGVIEMTSFEKVDQYKINFVEKLGETLTSMLTALRANEQTHKLLEQSKMQAEEMSAQEEELRQNLEEMQATQEEASRREEDLRRATASFEEKEAKYVKEIKKLQTEIKELKK